MHLCPSLAKLEAILLFHGLVIARPWDTESTHSIVGVTTLSFSEPIQTLHSTTLAAFQFMNLTRRTLATSNMCCRGVRQSRIGGKAMFEVEQLILRVTIEDLELLANLAPKLLWKFSSLEGSLLVFVIAASIDRIRFA